MSLIPNAVLSTVFAGGDAKAALTGPLQSAASAAARAGARAGAPADNIGRPILGSLYSSAAPLASQAQASAPAGGWNFMSIFSNFIDQISQLFAQLGASLGSSAPPQGAQTSYANASASSVGDPHDSFTGTAANGANTGGKWDDMHSHSNLLSSDSFAGGYRVATTATQPSAKGVTLNANATVSTNGGATNVSLSGDGSYAVSSDGRNLVLQQGVAASLGNGETVTLNADKSLTVNDTNAAGGSIATTLKTNDAGGVDVNSTAHNVDLGGYLADHSDSDPDPTANAARATGYASPMGALTFPSTLPTLTMPAPLLPLTQPMGSGASDLSGDLTQEPFTLA